MVLKKHNVFLNLVALKFNSSRNVLKKGMYLLENRIKNYTFLNIANWIGFIHSLVKKIFFFNLSKIENYEIYHEMTYRLFFDKCFHLKNRYMHKT